MKQMKKKLRIILLVAVLVGIGVTVTFLNKESDTDQLILYGNVDMREVDLAFRVSGRLVQMHFDEGDAVKKDDILASLDDEPHANQLAVALAQLGRAEVELKKFEAGSRPQEIQVAEAAVQEAQAFFDSAELEYNRQKELFTTRATSRKAYDLAKASHDEARARLNSAKENLALIREGFRSEDIQMRRQELEAAKASYDVAKTALNDTILRAPNAGIITTRIHEPGAVLASGTPVYSLLLHSPVYVRAYVAEPALGQVAPGTKVEINTDSGDTRYRGQIGFVSPRAEFTPKSVETTDLRTDLVYRLRIVVENPDSGLRQGMPLTIRLLNQEKSQ